MAFRAVCAVVFLFSLVSSANLQSAEINGTLTTSDGKPIAGAIVRVYHRGAKFHAKTTTDAKGEYTLKIADDKIIDWIQYDMTGYHPGTVKLLSASKSQTICKVLLKGDEIVGLAEQINQWASYEQVFWIWKLVPEEGEKNKLERRQEYLRMMKELSALSKDELVSGNSRRIMSMFEKEF